MLSRRQLLWQLEKSKTFTILFGKKCKLNAIRAILKSFINVPISTGRKVPSCAVLNIFVRIAKTECIQIYLLRKNC